MFIGYSASNVHAEEVSLINTPDKPFTLDVDGDLIKLVEDVDFDEGTVETYAAPTKVRLPTNAGTLGNFNVAKGVGARTTNHSNYSGRTLPSTASPNSSKDLIFENKIKQRRYYAANGKVIQDIDYFHPGVGHKFPHIHYFDWSKMTPRSGAYPSTY